jgi:hypothetical protein
VHGEDNPAVAFRERLIDAGFTHVDVPVYRQKFKLSS